MNCPYYQAQLEPTEHDNIYHCPQCQGNWLPPRLTSKLEKQTIDQLESQSPSKEIDPPQTPRCPVCQDRLSLIRPNKSSIQIWNCPQGHGSFYPHQHLKKLSQQKPSSPFNLRSLIGVLVPTLLILSVTAGLPLTIRYLTQPEPQTQPAQASATISQPQITQVPPNSALVSFSTSQPVTSKLKLYNSLPESNNQPPLYTYTVSQEPQTQHRATLSDLNKDQVYYFTLTITDQKNRTTTTEPETLTINP